jgi:ribonucleoside-triphosphate reductase
VYDVVDALWLLLLGCGVGFKPIVGSLNGFAKPIPNIEVIRSKRTEKGGRENNVQSWDPDTRTWTVSIGDSSEAWAKAIGKILAGKFPANRLVLDFSEVRPAGIRMSNFGWISSGDENISKAFLEIANIMNRRAGSLLTKIDIMDVMNWLGTSLSSRRSAQICFVDYAANEWAEFAVAKKEFWITGNPQRAQSNNSLLFRQRPTEEELTRVFDMMIEAGGSEPGFVNGLEAEKRAPWFAGTNPCAEILLPNKGFCNLCETDIGKFRGDTAGLHSALRLVARANYRQTCVNLKDGILQEAWHLSNLFLRLCGVGLTGVARRGDLIDYDYRQMERVATNGAFSMADELNLPRPKNVTTIKPSGTLSKVFATTEGAHKPLGKYIFNNVIFAKGDPLVERLKAANYRYFEHPFQATNIVFTLPVAWNDIEFTKVKKGDRVLEVNLESAIEQLDRYKMLQNNWTHQNTSVTISYSPEEAPGIVKWLMENWGSYVGVSFIYRSDPTKTAEDLGYPYLPQQVVTREEYEAYVAELKPVDLSGTESTELMSDTAECAGGVCPVR